MGNDDVKKALVCDELEDVLRRTALFMQGNRQIADRIFRVCAIHGIAMKLNCAAALLQEYKERMLMEVPHERT